MAAKADFKRELAEFYAARRSPAIVEVPELAFVMIAGHGDPNTSGAYRDAVAALFSVSCAARFALKRAGVIDFGVMPLEGLWWVSDMSAFSSGDKSAWDWTMLVIQPDEVTADVLADAKVTAAAKAPAAALERRHLFTSAVEPTMSALLAARALFPRRAVTYDILRRRTVRPSNDSQLKSGSRKITCDLTLNPAAFTCTGRVAQLGCRNPHMPQVRWQ